MPLRKVVLVLNTMTAGGAQRVAATLANAWVAKGCQVTLITTYLRQTELHYELDSRVACVNFSSELAKARPSTITAPLHKVRTLRTLLRRLDPDTTISFLTNVNVLTIVASRFLTTQVIVSERVDPAGDKELTRLLILARQALYWLADALVVQTAGTAARLKQRLLIAPRIFTIPNPLPHAIPDMRTRSEGRGLGGTVVGVGRLVEQKQFDQLIRAFARALGDNSDWKLAIWGEGPQRVYLQRQIDSLGLTNRIRLPGNTREIWTQLQRAQLFVLSSAFEGFPNAMLEAMALGIPCIAYACPAGPSELANGGSAARLVPVNREDLLAIEIATLAYDRSAAEQMADRGAHFVRSQFGEQAVLGQWQSLFDSVLTSGKARAH